MIRIALATAVAALLAGCSASAPELTVPQGRGWLDTPDRPTPAGGRPDAPAPDAPPALDGETFTLRDAIELALADNPGLHASRAQWLAARERPRQVTLPDPVIEYTWFPEPIETRFGPQRHRVAVMQHVPWPGRLSAEGAAREADAEVARFGYEIEARNLIAEVTVAWHELLWLDRAADVVEAHRALAARLAAIGESLQAEESADDATTVPMRRSVVLVDALKARAQEAQLAFDQVTIAENRRVAESRLNRLLGRDPLAPLPAPAPLADVRLTADLESLSSELLQHRQELSRAAARAGAMGHRVEAAQLTAVPDFRFGVMWSAIAQPLGGSAGGTGLDNDAFGLTVGVTLPLFASRNQARVDEAAWQQRAAVDSGRQLTLDAVAELAAAFTKATRAERLVQLYRDTLVPQAVHALQQVEALQTEDETTFGELLEAQMVKLTFELALARARTERFIAISRLEQLIGRPLAGHLEAAGEPS